MTERERQPLAVIVALIVPLLILGGWWVGARVATDDAAAAPRAVLDIEAQLASEPDVVVMGNSASFHGVDEAALGAALGVPGKVAKIYIPASRSPAWYAMLENRIIEAGHRPRLVVVVGALYHMLDTSMNDQQALLLREQMDDDDALIEQKAFGSASFGGFTSKSRAAAEQWFEAPKLMAVGAVWGDGQGALAEQGRRVADPAMGRLFALDGGSDMNLHTRAGPIAAGQDPDAGGDLSTMSVDGSMIGDMAKLAKQSGIRLVFVSFPLPSTNPTPKPGPDWQKQVVELLNTHGAGWLDLSGAPLPASAWLDHIHLHAAGRTQFTQMLIQGLLQLNPLGDGAMAPSGLPIAASRIERVGAPDALPALPPAKVDGCRRTFPVPALASLANKEIYDRTGLGNASPIVLLRDGAPLKANVQPAAQQCDDTWIHGTGALAASVTRDGVFTAAWNEASPGTARVKNQDVPVWWVYPGTALEVAVDVPWEDRRGPFLVQLDAVGGDGARAQLSVGETRAELPPAADGVIRARIAPAAPTGPWVVRVSVPSGAPALIVRGLSVGDGAQAASLIGERSAPGVRILGGRHPGRTITVAKPPPALPSAGAPKPDKVSVPHPKARLKLDALADLAPGPVRERTAVGGCSPLLVFEDGVPIGPAHAAVKDVQEIGKGAWAAQPGGVLLTASDNSDPATNGRTYTLALDADRTCKDAVWTYPGDTLQIVLDPVGALPQGATAIDLTGMAFVSDPGDRSVAVRVEADGVQVYKDNVLIRALAEVTQLPLSPPIRAGVKAVKVTIDAPADGPYILFIGASLVAPEAEPLVRAVAAPEATPAAPAAPAPTGGTLEFDLTSPRVDPKNLMQLIKLDAAPEDSVVAAAAMSTGEPGLRFEAKAAASSRLCTGRFVVRGAGTARVHANPVSVPPSPNKAAGLRFEVTYFGEDKQPLRVDGKIVSVGVPLPTSGGWAWTDLDVSPPAGAAQAQLCVRFAKSTGVVELDGMTAQGEPLGK